MVGIGLCLGCIGLSVVVLGLVIMVFGGGGVFVVFLLYGVVIVGGVRFIGIMSLIVVVYVSDIDMI